MSLREQFTEQLKASMKAGDAARTSTLRMILAKLKDTDIAARPKGIDKVPDEEIARHAARHGQIPPRSRWRSTSRATGPNWRPRRKPRSPSSRAFLPQQMDDAAIEQAVADGDRRDRRRQHQGHGQGDGRAAGEARARRSTWRKAGPMVKAKLS